MRALAHLPDVVLVCLCIASGKRNIERLRVNSTLLRTFFHLRRLSDGPSRLIGCYDGFEPAYTGSAADTYAPDSYSRGNRSGSRNRGWPSNIELDHYVRSQCFVPDYRHVPRTLWFDGITNAIIRESHTRLQRRHDGTTPARSAGSFQLPDTINQRQPSAGKLRMANTITAYF